MFAFVVFDNFSISTLISQETGWKKRLFLSTSLVFPYFFVPVPCAGLNWPTAINYSFIHLFIHFICSTKIKTEALQIENEQDSKANIYALTAALTNNIKM